MITSIGLTSLAARSQKNSYARQVFGLFTYAEGARRQVTSVLSHLGITSSYTALVGNQRARDIPEDHSKQVTGAAEVEGLCW